MREINTEQLKAILEEHLKWLKDNSTGKRADFYNVNLRYTNLSCANLSNADLRNADLRNADLRNADLSNADLRNADLSYADLSNANLNNANLVIFQYQRHTAYFTNADGMLRIGCQHRHITEWRKKYARLGKDFEYSELEIAVYGSFIKSCNKLHKTKVK